MTVATTKRPTALAIWLIFAGVVGLIAAFTLTMDDIRSLEDDTFNPACNFSPIFQCSANLESWQGSAFGFPNPLIGLVCWMAPIVVGMAILSGARFSKWFWALYAIGHTLAFGFVCWLAFQSIFRIGTLCPWCMVTWVVTIPSFYAVVLHAVRIGAIPLGRGGRKLADTLMGWLPLLVTVSFLIIAIAAVIRLDLFSSLLG
ncbi:MAG: vitamin K epoxide reductase family protein [Microbacterium gubbeenense]|uniref:vitamin K epoxide reductase family protein n=1 Tax=Microbacterium gubbeenense TaxID=159896 RepID=UPI00041AD764|nr:vitamin K epoxide reductase family protein [Microbacterium gubbeenense]